MIQYLEMLKAIKDRGTHKPSAREGLPGSLSLFGYQNRYNLADGFPILTTKKMYWKGIVVELLWFLRGDTNIKYLVDNNVNIWNEDAYNYYYKCGKKETVWFMPEQYGSFIKSIKDGTHDPNEVLFKRTGYKFGDCGFQYGKVWRRWEELYLNTTAWEGEERRYVDYYKTREIDQLSRLLENLKTNPESRRHIVTAIDPVHDEDLALYWCHALFQFNCRPLSLEERAKHQDLSLMMGDKELGEKLEEYNTPKYYLDCQLYQRSADAFLGVPFNISSYALLIHIIAKICNMIPGEFVHTFGDVHIYDNHMKQVDEILTREPHTLPKLVMTEETFEWHSASLGNFYEFMPSDFVLEDYNPQPSIEAELSTGIQKR